MKIALIHDWLVGVGGAERVLKALHELYPDAPIYVLFHDPGFTRSFLPNAHIRSSSLQKFYSLQHSHRLMSPFMPTAVESFDLSDFDVVISNGPIYSKGIITRPKTIHINYCHHPTRQVWDRSAEHRREAGIVKRPWLSIMQHLTRLWDADASGRVDHYIANSKNVRRRIAKYYRRDATVIYPPVELNDRFAKSLPTNYYLIVSRLFKHKNIDIAIRTCNKMRWPLIIVGEGPEYSALQSIAGNTVRMTGWLSESETADMYRNCRAFLMPQEEDFGIAPIEALSHGKPVVALKKGGALEYIKDGINGTFFDDPAEEVLADAIRRMEEMYDTFDPIIIRNSAEPFGRARFDGQIRSFVSGCLQ